MGRVEHTLEQPPHIHTISTRGKKAQGNRKRWTKAIKKGNEIVWMKELIRKKEVGRVDGRV